MTTYRLMDGVSGRPGVGSTGTQPPTSPTATTGGWLLGTLFTVTGGVRWLNGYYFWVPTGGDTGAQKFALWNVYATSETALLVSGSTVTSGTLTAGAFNSVPLATPIQLAPGELYVAATGWTAVNGIPLTSAQFGSGDPYASGITNGPVTAWPNMNLGGTSPFPWSTAYGAGQGLFSNVLGADPTAAMPNNGSGSDLLWVDVVISDTAPGGYSGSYRLHPGATTLGPSENVTADTANNFTLGSEFSVTEACDVNNIWFYSPPGLTQLPTAIGVFNVTGPVTVAASSSPSWSGAAGSGWIKAALSATLQAGNTYKVGVCNGAGSPAIWNDAITDYWDPGNGFGGNGLTAGPLSFPSTATATSPGHASYNPGATLTFPATNVGPYDYGVDIEVTPAAAGPASGSGLLMASFP